MKGCALSSLLWIAGYLAITGAITGALHGRYGLGAADTWMIAGAAGFCAWIASAMLAGIWEALRERMALQGCLDGKRPADGSRSAIAGRIDAPGQRLRSPLSGTDCVAYRYEVFASRSQRPSKTSSARIFDGMALVPSAIQTPAGSFRLLAVPTFDFPAQELDRETVARNAHEHLRAAQFETIRSMKQEWSDDDGAFRRDEKHALGDVDKLSKYPELTLFNPKDPGDPNVRAIDLADCQFFEQVVKRGDSVCVFGLYSQQRGGIIPHSNWGKATRIIRGDAESLIRGLQRRIAWYALFGALFLAAALGILAHFQ